MSRLINNDDVCPRSPSGLKESQHKKKTQTHHAWVIQYKGCVFINIMNDFYLPFMHVERVDGSHHHGTWWIGAVVLWVVFQHMSEI